MLGQGPSRTEMGALSMFAPTANENQQKDGGELLGGLAGTTSSLQIISQMSSTSVVATQKATKLLNNLTNELRKVFEKHAAKRTKTEMALNARLASSMNLLWDDRSPLLNHLSQMVTRVSAIDTGAAARLLDSVLSALPVNNTDILATIPGIASEASVDTSDMLPFVIPALASVMDKHVNQCDNCGATDLTNAFDGIVSQGCVVISLLVAAEECITRIEVQKVLDQIASISCLAAQHLKLSLCLISRRSQGVHYQIQVPCLVMEVQPPPSSEPPRQNTIDGPSASKLPWEVTTLSSAGDYTFSSSTTAPSQSPNPTKVRSYVDSAASGNAQQAALPSPYGSGEPISTSKPSTGPSLPEYSGKVMQPCYCSKV